MAEPNYISPQEKLKQYYKSQAQKGAKAVTSTTSKFAKDYIEPVIKTGAVAYGLSFGAPITAATLLTPKALAMMGSNLYLGYKLNQEDDPYLETATSVLGNIVKPQMNEQLKRIGGINDFLQAKKRI